MKKIISLIVVSLLLLTAACSSKPEGMVSSVPSLIKEGFTSNTEYEIICRGFPKEGLEGVQKDESAKRAALLNAYYFTRLKFDDTVIPDRDGKAERFVINQDHAVVYYTISKPDLKSRIRK